LELRHLRYFVAVAEEGSLSVAARSRLFTAQPSLSRQIRDLELEVGTDLLVRSAQGVALTGAGRAFLDHARLALAQVDAAGEAARRAARPSKPVFGVGFLTGQEMDWLPQAMRVLSDALPNIEVKVVSQYSPQLADALVRGTLDVAFMRREPDAGNLEFRLLKQEPLVAVLASDHALAAREFLSPEDLRGQIFINVSSTAPALRRVIDGYLENTGLNIKAEHEVDNLAMAVSMVASMRGVALLPIYAQNFLPWSVVSRPLAGLAPSIDLVLGYKRGNTSEVLQLFLSRVDALNHPK
jgi:LysR family hca operon transcriptional activator